MTEVEYIKAQLAETERLLGLTEEALELALAALKLHRVIDGQNPTPVTYDQAISNLLEEYGDVTNCIEVLITPSQNKDAMQSRFEKRSRWVHRLESMPYREWTCSCGWTWQKVGNCGCPDHCPCCGRKVGVRFDAD